METTPIASKATVRISYCPACGWLLRAAWFAQELLTTFADELDAVALAPASKGTFQVTVNDVLVWERKRDGGFPQASELKRLVRDVAAPHKQLGHSEGSKTA